MDNIISDVKKIVEQIKNCDIYKEYLDIKKVIEKNDILKKEIQDFKQAQTQYEIKRLQNTETDFGEEQYISKLYSDLMLKEDARKFLLREQSILELVKNTNEIIMSSFEHDIDIPM